MAIKRDYRDYRKPRLWSYEILIRFIELEKPYFTSRDISKLFGLSHAEACTRINTLKRYHLIKRVEPKTWPVTYEISNWGLKYANFKREKNGK
jgi:Fic family protein